MANVENLTPFTSEQSREEAVKNGQKGGIASGKSRREKKTIQKILADLLDTNVGDIPQMDKSLQKLGIEGDKPLKDVFTLVATLNTLKTANLSDLVQLSKMLGEDNAKEHNNGILDELTEYMKNDKSDAE